MGKITLTNIAEELAVRSGLDKETADSFVRAFVATIEKGLDADHLVKIKGLGTFKLMDMNDRSSVDVNSGERITIKGYTKVSFTPDSSMKEFINRPFAHFEPTELNEGYPDEEVPEETTLEPVAEDSVAVEPAEEIVQEATETEVEAVVEEVVETIVEEVTEPVAEEAPEVVTPEVVAEEPIAEEPIAEEVVADMPETDTPSEQPVEEAPADNTPAEAEQEVQAVQPAPEVAPQSKRPRRGGWLIALLLIALVGGAYYYISIDGVGDMSSDEYVEELDHIAVNPNLGKELGAEFGDLPVKESSPAVAEPVQADPVVAQSAPIADADSVEAVEASPSPAVEEGSVEAVSEPAPAPVVQEPKPASPAKSDTLVIVPSLASKTIQDITPADTTSYLITGTQATHKLRNGETLIMLSRKYYGDKRLWPYIAKHNGITDFNKVAIGMSIRIPILEAKE